MQLINYWHEKEIGEKIPDGQVIEPVRQLVSSQSAGGVTALMYAAECLSGESITFLLKIGANPLELDYNGRIAR